jgi:hypothetical protein
MLGLLKPKRVLGPIDFVVVPPIPAFASLTIEEGATPNIPLANIKGFLNIMPEISQDNSFSILMTPFFKDFYYTLK